MTAATQTQPAQTVDQFEPSTQLEKATERAERYHITVQAQGHRKFDNARIWCTNSHSAEAGCWHVVVLQPRSHRLVCDCASRVVCSHRAAVHMSLVIEAAKLADFTARVEAANAADRAHSSIRTGRLMDDDKPVSMWK